MNPSRIIPFVLLAAPLSAQDIAPKDSERDPILTELLEGEPVPSDEEEAVLVTGNPPADARKIEDEDAENPEDSEPAGDDDIAEAETEAEANSENAESTDKQVEEAPAGEAEPAGIRIDVQGGGSAPVSPEDIDIVAPFPAKPLASPPSGWRLAQPDAVPAAAHEVELKNGTTLKLSIRPHVLVPDADGDQVFALAEPGFDSVKGYAQTDTVGAILAESIHSLDEQTDRLAAASQLLSELLDSLPPDPPVAQPVPEPTESDPAEP